MGASFRHYHPLTKVEPIHSPYTFLVSLYNNDRNDSVMNELHAACQWRRSSWHRRVKRTNHRARQSARVFTLINDDTFNPLHAK